MDTKHIANRILCALVEAKNEIWEGAPEGILYAGLMNEISLDEFNAIVSTIIKLGLAERISPNFLVATDKTIKAYSQAKTANKMSK